MPPEAKDHAANLAEQCGDFVNDCLATLLNQLNAVWNAVMDFLKGVFNVLKNAYQKVAGAANSAIKGIASLFGGTV